MNIAFTVNARAVPQGSKRHVGNGRLVEQAGSALKVFRAAVAYSATQVCANPTREPVSVSLVFTFMRPASHYTTRGELKGSAPYYPYPAKRGDVDKLARATLDAITGTVIYDDAQVVELAASVQYGPEYQTWVGVSSLELKEFDTRR